MVGFVVTNHNQPPEGLTHFYNGRGTAQRPINKKSEINADGAASSI